MADAMTIGGDQQRIDEEASAWLVLSEERELDRAEQQAFDAWRAASPQHERTYQELRRTWDELPSLTDLTSLAPPAARVARPETRTPRWAGGRIAVAALVAAAAALALILLPSLIGGPGRQYSTEIAQTRLLALPDGSQVTLGPRSTLAVAFTETERRVRLTGGEAFFEVTHDVARPFLVEAGASLIRVVGTRFDVNRGAETVRVSVLDGLVQVSEHADGSAAPARVLLLRAGERAELAISAAASRSSSMRAQPAREPGAWREGRMVYEDVRLADLVTDVNRYYAPGVALTGDAGQLRVTAAFRASEIPAFMSALADVVPVNVAEAPDGSFRVEPARD